MKPHSAEADQAREQAIEELSKPEYAEARSIMFELRSLAGELLNRISNSTTNVATTVTIILVALLAILIIIVLSRLSWQRSARSGDDSLASAEVSPPATLEEVIARANTADAAQDYETATRSWFRAIAMVISDDDTDAADTAALTATEVAIRASAMHPECAPKVHAAARTFNAMAYGHRQATQQYSATIKEAFDDLAGQVAKAKAEAAATTSMEPQP